MRVAITGASGLIGGALTATLARGGNDVLQLRRRLEAVRGDPKGVYWNPDAGEIDAARLAGVDAVVHLAGEPIAGLWTPAKKRRIRRSRVRGTELVARTLAELPDPPRVFVSASGMNYYGDRDPAEPIEEHEPPGDGFLAAVCRAWEQATEPAAVAGIRVVRARFAVVLDPAGGMLQALLPLFRFGLGGRVGSGRQPLGWVALDDAVRALGHALETDALEGPVNIASPHPVTNAEFARTLGRVLRRPTVLRMPAFAARMLPGGMGTEMLLSGARVVPGRLVETGFRFGHPRLEPALRHLLGRPG